MFEYLNNKKNHDIVFRGITCNSWDSLTHMCDCVIKCISFCLLPVTICTISVVADKIKLDFVVCYFNVVSFL